MPENLGDLLPIPDPPPAPPYPFSLPRGLADRPFAELPPAHQQRILRRIAISTAAVPDPPEPTP